MNLLRKDYRKLYLLQDKFLSWWIKLGLPFYLTGGTALGRFYLNHRFSEDLDFFINRDPLYSDYIKKITTEIQKEFNVNLKQALFTDEFSRIFIIDEDLSLKLEFVNDVSFRSGNPVSAYFGLLDTPYNILSNKLTAVLSRDEPKDIFDIVHISLNYSFNWQTVFDDAKQKSVINEIDIEERLCNFPPEMLKNIDWNMMPVDLEFFSSKLRRIADDFLLGRDNSLCQNINPLTEAQPL
ncbi:MAG TPA: nucleotidyl transferase AbiEii/AbiGii toxin family protein [Bacteroidales bacterium]|nr:nucleotidyl transferase AbiEii/AbiGii toxin family protein [Bacteroidales bacterium]